MPKVSTSSKMITQAKVSKMGEVIAEFQQKIGELEVRLVSSTPPRSDGVATKTTIGGCLRHQGR